MKLVLIGDSIRRGYQETVAEILEEAEVCVPEDNCKDSANLLAHLDEWVIDHKPDMVHLNCGLHDIKYPIGETKNLTPLQTYYANLDTIFRRILGETPAKLVWATTTPVNEALHNGRKGTDRYEADVKLYNDSAAEVAYRHRVPINDLHAFVMARGRDELQREDGVHYTPEGSVALGRQVAAFIRKLRAGE